MYDFRKLTTPPDGRYHILETPDGTRLRCVSMGEGPTVVLAHGFMLSLNGYIPVIDELVARGYRVVAFDQRGHGGSSVGSEGFGWRTMVDDYRAVLEHYDVTDGVLVGHSMGAFLSVVFSLSYAEIARERLRGLVLIGGHAGAVAKGSLPNRLQIPLIRWGITKVLLSFKPLAHAIVRSMFGDEVDPVYLEVCRQMGEIALRNDTAGILDDMVRLDFYSRIGEIDVETVVLCGERDATCPRWHSEWLGAKIPRARNVWLPGVGHMVPYETPSVVVREIESLVDV
jgi:non-heme chloroperoxidase